MGIDIYMSWKDQTEQEKKARYTGFSTVSGNVGYLREAYHGGPYFTEVLVPESFEDKVSIDYMILLSRLDNAIETIKIRYKNIYNDTLTDDSKEVQSIRDFVELAGRKQKETGEPVTIYASY